MLIRLRGCAGWSAPLLLANPQEDRLSRDEANFFLSITGLVNTNVQTGCEPNDLKMDFCSFDNGFNLQLI